MSELAALGVVASIFLLFAVFGTLLVAYLHGKFDKVLCSHNYYHQQKGTFLILKCKNCGHMKVLKAPEEN